MAVLELAMKLVGNSQDFRVHGPFTIQNKPLSSWTNFPLCIYMNAMPHHIGMHLSNYLRKAALILLRNNAEVFTVKSLSVGSNQVTTFVLPFKPHGGNPQVEKKKKRKKNYESLKMIFSSRRETGARLLFVAMGRYKHKLAGCLKKLSHPLLPPGHATRLSYYFYISFKKLV